MNETATKILSAARERLLVSGFSAMSTRAVADAAGVPLSQIHYHFGTKEELILSLLRNENDQLINRQRALFESAESLSHKWKVACDYLDEDIDSGYVRVLQEMIAAGYSSEPIGVAVREILSTWFNELTSVISEAGVDLGLLNAQGIAAPVSSLFIGAETLILSGHESDAVPIRLALRQIGELIQIVEGGQS